MYTILVVHRPCTRHYVPRTCTSIVLVPRTVSYPCHYVTSFHVPRLLD
jgi:hypothetical protein